MESNGINLIFPSKAIESLHNIRGEKWESLITDVTQMDEANPDRIAFVLMMVKLGGCVSCQSDSFRAMRGCNHCSITTIKRYKGNDQALLDLYNEAKAEVNKYLDEV